MQIFALFMFLGMFTTLLIPETKRKTLEQLAGEVPGTPEYNPDNLRGVGGGAKSRGIDSPNADDIEKQTHEHEGKAV
jgi:PHS family inorganic phosphate transporter-like MFS transporter